MTRYVLKFGGTSVANLARLQHVADIIRERLEKGHEVAVVVSAMAGITNELVSFAKTFCSDRMTPEYDVVCASGEQVTSGLLALALQRIGIPARSYLSWQIPILTTSTPGVARIMDIPNAGLESFLESRVVPVIAGFQGLSPEGRVTTLGRGGSDTTAVALAAVLKASRCDIYTDVEGIYTADPHLVPNARKLDYITYSEMFELSSQGARVLQARSVELAMKKEVVIQVLSSFVDSEGTYIVKHIPVMETSMISGIAHSDNEAKIIIRGIPDEVGVASRIFGPLAREQIHVDMITQSHVAEGITHLSFTVLQTDLERVLPILEVVRGTLSFHDFVVDRHVSKVSVVGVGLRSDLEIVSMVFKALADAKINIQMVSTSEIKMSVLLSHQHMAQAVRILHDTFCLNAK